MIRTLSDWSEAVRNRDGVCVDCGADQNLHAHHIKLKSEFPELALDLDNGVCVCRSCHAKRHSDAPGISALVLNGRTGNRTKLRLVDKDYVPSTALDEILSRIHWSQQTFADQVGVSLRTVKRWARDNDKSPGKRVAMKYLEMLCRIIGV